MALSASQILALCYGFNLPRKTVLTLARSFDDNPASNELLERMIEYTGKPISLEILQEQLASASQNLKDSESLGIHAVTCFDPEFPQKLKDTCTPKGESDPPIVIFCKGNLELLNAAGVAVIGSRFHTSKAEPVGRFVAHALADEGICIVSGLALGCDTFAHEGALASAHGKTIAVLAHGLDTVYPPANLELAKTIVDRGGLLISEYPIGTPVSPERLIERDRLQAALSFATIVIQTRDNGGSFHAAKATVASGKPLYVVKFTDAATDNDPKTLGNHVLVRDFGAQYIGGTKDRAVFEAQLKEICQVKP